MNYYNEIDPYAAKWLRNLIYAGLIPEGDVDERSIEDVKPAELRGYTQCHFFAGIAGWPLALQLAGIPADRPLWTGSCPCQPFSVAGKGAGAADERHLWPAWFHLIRQCKPPIVFGEQVASAIRHGWLDLVSADLEAENYAVGSAVLGAHSVGAPHIRQRLYWVADASGARLEGRQRVLGGGDERATRAGGVVGGLANTNGRDASAEREQCGGEQRQQSADSGASELGNADSSYEGKEHGVSPKHCTSSARVLTDGSARLTASGQLLTGSDAGMESGGQLSPHMSRWLMGYPPEWCMLSPDRKTMKGKK